MRDLFLGRSCPGRAATFSSLPKKNVTKKKGTPVRRSPDGRLPCVARHAGRRIRTRAIRCAATRSNMNPPTAPAQLRYSAARRGPKSVAVFVVGLRFT